MDRNELISLYARNGLAAIPLNGHGDDAKKPRVDIRWKGLFKDPANAHKYKDLACETAFIGVGPISGGGVTIFDFDIDKTQGRFNRWDDFTREFKIPGAPAGADVLRTLISLGCWIEKTPSGGMHLYVKDSKVGPETFKRICEGGWDLLAQGGSYAACYPFPGYSFLHPLGDLQDNPGLALSIGAFFAEKQNAAKASAKVTQQRDSITAKLLEELKQVPPQSYNSFMFEGETQFAKWINTYIAEAYSNSREKPSPDVVIRASWPDFKVLTEQSGWERKNPGDTEREFSRRVEHLVDGWDPKFAPSTGKGDNSKKSAAGRPSGPDDFKVLNLICPDETKLSFNLKTPLQLLLEDYFLPRILKAQLDGKENFLRGRYALGIIDGQVRLLIRNKITGDLGLELSDKMKINDLCQSIKQWVCDQYAKLISKNEMDEDDLSESRNQLTIWLQRESFKLHNFAAILQSMNELLEKKYALKIPLAITPADDANNKVCGPAIVFSDWECLPTHKPFLDRVEEAATLNYLDREKKVEELIELWNKHRLSIRLTHIGYTPVYGDIEKIINPTDDEGIRKEVYQRIFGCKIASFLLSPSPRVLKRLDTWCKFVSTATGDDPELTTYLKLVSGYSTSPIRNYINLCVILMGPGGTGKSTFLDHLSAALGNYSHKLASDTFTQVSGGDRRFVFSGCDGKLFTFLEEPKGGYLDGELLKDYVGGETLPIQKKGKDCADLPNLTKLMIGCNTFPKTDLSDDGVLRRLTVIPFEVDMRSRYRGDTQMSEDATKSAVLYWLWEGMLEAQGALGRDILWHASKRPACTRKAIEEARRDHTPAIFAESRVEASKYDSISNDDLYDAYREYAPDDAKRRNRQTVVKELVAAVELVIGTANVTRKEKVKSVRSGLWGRGLGGVAWKRGEEVLSNSSGVGDVSDLLN